MDDIILIALTAEAPIMARWSNVFFTGVGKVNAALTASALIERHKPKRVWNFGTAGGIDPDISGLLEISNFVQRDMKCCELGFDEGLTPFETEKVIGPGTGFTCSTGDNFVIDPNLTIPADVVDMEAYAIAKACQYHGVEFKCFKYISDNANDEANDDWAISVADGEKYYIQVYSLGRKDLYKNTLFTFTQSKIDTSILYPLYDRVNNGRDKKLELIVEDNILKESKTDMILRPGYLFLEKDGYLEFSSWADDINLNETEHKLVNLLQSSIGKLRFGFNIVQPNATVRLHTDKSNAGIQQKGRPHNILIPLHAEEYKINLDGYSEIIPKDTCIVLNTNELHGVTNITDKPLVFFHYFYIQEAAVPFTEVINTVQQTIAD